MPPDHLHVFARLILGHYRDVIGSANVDWLICRSEHNDWLASDEIRMREMLPGDAWRLLRAASDHLSEPPCVRPFTQAEE